MIRADGNAASIMQPEAMDALSFASEPFQAVYAWLVSEAEMLDTGRFGEWLDRISRDIVYRAPVRVTVGNSLGDSLPADMHLFHEDFYSLSKRVERLATEHAWADDPPSRTRRFVTNIQVYEGGSPDSWVARSYLLLYRSRGSQAAEIISAARRDMFVGDDQGLRLEGRVVAVDDSVLHSQSISFLL